MLNPGSWRTNLQLVNDVYKLGRQSPLDNSGTPIRWLSRSNSLGVCWESSRVLSKMLKKFTNCRLVRDGKLVRDDLWVRKVWTIPVWDVEKVSCCCAHNGLLSEVMYTSCTGCDFGSRKDILWRENCRWWNLGLQQCHHRSWIHWHSGKNRLISHY